MTTGFDVVVVGAGHNGLTCAAYLARTGARVAVVEARDVVGGYCTSAETVESAPGFVFNEAAIDFIMTNIPPTVADELALHRYGLEWVHPDPFLTFLNPDGASIAFWRDKHRTEAEIARFSRRDAEQYRRFTEVLRDLWSTLVPYFQTHPRRVGFGAVLETLRRGVGARRNLGAGARILLSSPLAVLEEWFEREELKTALACWALWALGPLDEPGNAAAMAYPALSHEWGLRRPVGGSGSFTRALAACIEAHGGEIRTSSPVREIATAGRQATGVVLETGERLRARQVVAALDPVTLLTRLVDPGLIPDAVRAELRGLQVGHSNLGIFKGDVAVRERLVFPRSGRPDDELASLFLASDVASLVRATDAARRGELTDELPMWVIIPSVFDRTLVPAGSAGDTVYVWPLVGGPIELALGAEWSKLKDDHLDACLAAFETYAPGVRDVMIGSLAVSPDELAARVHRGNVFHVDHTLTQFGPGRPTPSLNGYRTPVDGLWHTGAGAHPMGGLNGWSGRTAARTVLRHLRR